MTTALTPARLRDMCREIVGQGAYGEGMLMAESDAAIRVLEAVCIYHFGEHVKREDVHEYMRLVWEADRLELDMPQSNEPASERESWEFTKDRAESGLAEIGARIVGQA